MNSVLSASFIEYIRNSWNEAFNGEGMGEAVKDALEPHLVDFFGIGVNPALYFAIIVSFLLIVACILIRIFVIPKFKKIPKGFQLVLESMVTYFDKSTEQAVHKHASFVGPYVFTAAIFIGISTLAELISFRPAFSSINTCFAFGITTFIVINICGFKEKGALGRLKRYANPLNIISDLSVPLSLSLRLFGSILSGFIIMELLYSLIYTSFVIPSAVAIITTIFHALLQSYLFFTLTNIFVGEAIE